MTGMDTDTRVDNYLRQPGHGVLLTPAQVRRANHKLHSRKTHQHTEGQPCTRCLPPSHRGIKTATEPQRLIPAIPGMATRRAR
jgi:hypothetical protein